MKDILIVLGMCLIAIGVGAGLYAYGPSQFRAAAPEEAAAVAPAPVSALDEGVPFAVIASGLNAMDVSERKNFAAYDAEGFTTLWMMAYGEDGLAMPVIDFSEGYVIGVFAGDKPSGGYGIEVARVTDSADQRTVAVTLTTPGAGCLTTQALTSPFQIVMVPLSDHALARADQEAIVPCE